MIEILLFLAIVGLIVEQISTWIISFWREISALSEYVRIFLQLYFNKKLWIFEICNYALKGNMIWIFN